MDSNHDKQNQNLLCYRYTTGQSRLTYVLHTSSAVTRAREAKGATPARRAAGQTKPPARNWRARPIADELPEARAD
jgi:hypothetical protein